MPTLPDTSDGPERFHGSGRCPEHHAGVRTGINDICCCCDPCLYERPQSSTFSFCHRCAPQLICAVFVPDEGEEACCRNITSPILPSYSFNPPITTYNFNLGLEGSWQIAADEYGHGCYWRLQIPSLSIDTLYEIDHVNVTSLALPDVTFTGVIVPGSVADCTGTLSFIEYNSVKIPFINSFPGDTPIMLPDYDIDYPSPCNCTKAARGLCVGGVRHTGDLEEQVEFSWNTDYNDRWEYVPPCTDPSLTREVIYLRSDEDGNCYLELDFDRTGSDTNDWAVPPNTFDENYPHEIRPGMIRVDGCGCNLYVPLTYSSDLTKYITIHAGPCGGWHYVCGNCRCAPPKLCVIGSIDGVFVSDEATWEEIDLQFGWTMGSTRFVLGPGECPGNFPAPDGCAITYEGATYTQFARSDQIACGKFLSAELYPEYDPSTPNSDWIWLSSATCGTCNTYDCGPCTNERCGGPPRVLTVELLARSYNMDPYAPPIPDCDLSVDVYYWQRWDTTGPPIVVCGYIGFSGIIYCGADWFQIRVEINDFGAALRLYRRDNLHTTSGIPYWYEVQFNGDPLDVPPSTCDPFFFDSGWVADPTTVCYWGCVTKDEFRVIVSE